MQEQVIEDSIIEESAIEEAESENSESKEISINEESELIDDPQYGRANGYLDDGFVGISTFSEDIFILKNIKIT